MNAPLPGGAAAARVTHGRLIALALPVTLANLSTPLLGLVNAIVIGRLGDAAQLGAVALGAVIFDVVFWAFGFLRMGAAGLTAQAFGAGDEAELRNGFWRALLLALAIGLVLLLLRGALGDLTLAFMNPAPDVEREARAYFEARIWSAPFALANYAILGSLIGRARTDIGLAVQILINAVNIVFSLLFVWAFRSGVAGVAWASVIAEACGFVLGLYCQARAGLMRAPRWRGIFDRARLWRTLAVSRDIFLRSMLLIAALAFFTRESAAGGAVVLAANAVLQNFSMIGAFFLDGFATATEQMAGQAVGARDRRAFGRAVKLAALWCLGFGGVLSLFFAALGAGIVDLISTSVEVRATARDYLLLAALTPAAGALAFLFDGVFIGATWTRAMRNSMFIAVAIAAAVYGATLSLANVGLWLALLALFVARGLTQLALYPALERKTFTPPAPAPAGRSPA